MSDFTNSEVWEKACAWLKANGHGGLVEAWIMEDDLSKKKELSGRALGIFLEHHPEYATCCSEKALLAAGWVVSNENKHSAFSVLAGACGWQYVRTISPPQKNDTE